MLHKTYLLGGKDSEGRLGRDGYVVWLGLFIPLEGPPNCLVVFFGTVSLVISDQVDRQSPKCY